MSILLANFFEAKTKFMTYALKAIGCQLVAGVLLVLALMLFAAPAAWSALGGVVTMWIAQMPLNVLVWVFESGHYPPKTIVKWYMLGQIVKYIFVVAAVIMLVTLLHSVVWIWFIVGLLVVHLSGAMVTARVKRVAYS